MSVTDLTDANADARDRAPVVPAISRTWVRR